VPYVPINVRIFKTLKKTVDKLDFHRVCLQSEPIFFKMGFSLRYIISWLSHDLNTRREFVYDTIIEKNTIFLGVS
ncbi:hypothetical protein, partial [Peribacillus butanolivorans]